jgi:hypothetical protein
MNALVLVIADNVAAVGYESISNFVGIKCCVFLRIIHAEGVSCSM